MRPERPGNPASGSTAVPRRRSGPLRTLGGLCLALLLAGCAGELSPRSRAAPEQTPVLNRQATSASLLNEYLQLVQRLILGPASTQAEIAAAAQHEYEVTPTPSRELRLALVLATPGHPGRDLPRAQRLFRELMANPETLTDGERALAQLELSQIDDILTIEAENRRLQADAGRADRDRVASANRRLQAELDENARLRRELEEARAKLDAIANIERSLNERKPRNEGRP